MINPKIEKAKPIPGTVLLEWSEEVEWGDIHCSICGNFLIHAFWEKRYSSIQRRKIKSRIAHHMKCCHPPGSQIGIKFN